MTTPHLACATADIAELVLMPGDPMRADRIAQETLQDARVVSEIRGNRAWTGTYEGIPMTVLASGMGVPSMSLYATELYRFFDVKRICRVGTCGGISTDVAVADVILAASAHTNSATATFHVPSINLSLAAAPQMVAGALAASDDISAPVHVGSVYTSDFFYAERPDVIENLDTWHTLAVEMEAAGLYACAARAGQQALAVLTVSDHLKDGSADMSAKERETQFQNALTLAIAGLLA